MMFLFYSTSNYALPTGSIRFVFDGLQEDAEKIKDRLNRLLLYKYDRMALREYEKYAKSYQTMLSEYSALTYRERNILKDMADFTGYNKKLTLDEYTRQMILSPLRSYYYVETKKIGHKNDNNRTISK